MRGAPISWPPSRRGSPRRAKRGRPLLDAQRVLLARRAAAAPRRDQRPALRVRPSLPGLRAQAGRPFGAARSTTLRAEVLARCQLKPETRPQDAPWYFHYELGRDLYRRGDPQRALDALIEAATLRADPGHGARIYGMWFMDYLPVPGDRPRPRAARELGLRAERARVLTPGERGLRARQGVRGVPESRPRDREPPQEEVARTPTPGRSEPIDDRDQAFLQRASRSSPRSRSGSGRPARSPLRRCRGPGSNPGASGRRGRDR